jgi:hypothetical protein
MLLALQPAERYQFKLDLRPAADGPGVAVVGGGQIRLMGELKKLLML